MLGKNKSFVIRRLSKAINIEKICPSVTEAGFPLCDILPLSRYLVILLLYQNFLIIIALAILAKYSSSVLTNVLSHCAIVVSDIATVFIAQRAPSLSNIEACL